MDVVDDVDSVFENNIFEDGDDVEFGVLFAAILPLLVVEFEETFSERVGLDLHAVVVQEVGCNSVEIVVGLVGEDVGDGSVDVKNQSFNHHVSFV